MEANELLQGLMWFVAFLFSTTVHEAEPTPAVRERYAEARDRVLDRTT